MGLNHVSFSDGKMVILSDNPDDRLSASINERMMDALKQSFSEFIEECSVALRKLKPGKSITLKSTPFVVQMTREAESSKVTAEV